MTPKQFQDHVDNLSEVLLNKTRSYFGLMETEDLDANQAKIFLTVLQVFLHVTKAELEKVQKQKKEKRIIT